LLIKTSFASCNLIVENKKSRNFCFGFLHVNSIDLFSNQNID
jgi:hypothetical protein